MDKNIVVNIDMLAQLVDCLYGQKQFNPMETPEQKQLQATTEYVLTAVSRILSQSGNPQSFAGTQVGEHGIDGTKSSFL